MRVKEAVLTFVAMGGFAVPVIFQSPVSEGSAIDREEAVAEAPATPDEDEATDQA